jgi:ferritin-like metal-binding protein YciE
LPIAEGARIESALIQYLRINPAAVLSQGHPTLAGIILFRQEEQMALFSMKLDNLKALFVNELRDLYDAENQITKALPKLIDKSHNSQLKSGLQEHLEVTREQIRRLDRIFQMLNEKATGETCKGMKGLIAEGDEMVGHSGDSSVIDAGIISAAQRVEHYEMAGYGTVRTYAELLGQQEMANLLQRTLDEEKQADETLSQIAKTINVEAKAA